MSSKEQPKVAMLDTSFLIRLLKEDEPLHASAKMYFQYFLENKFVLFVSTVVVAEYCVKGRLDQLLYFGTSASNSRLRMNYDLRDSPDGGSQRMLNALMPGTQVPIQRHSNSSESVVVLCGSVLEMYYDDNGQ